MQVYKEQGDFLANANQSKGAWSYAFKIHPRPKGDSTKVVITEWDLPRKLAQPHDVVLDDEGHAWYSAFGDQKLGKVDLKTGATQEFDAALVRHATHLFGPLMPALEQLQIELDWQLGMVRRVVVPISDRVVQGGNLEALTRLLALPIMACLRELSVVGPWLAVRDPISAIPSEVRAGLRSLHLSAGAFGDLAPARVGELERLEALELLARRLSLPPLELPRLRRLTIGVEEFDDALVHALAHARLDALEELRLRLLWRVRGEDWVASLCEFVRVGPPQPIHHLIDKAVRPRGVHRNGAHPAQPGPQARLEEAVAEMARP